MQYEASNGTTYKFEKGRKEALCNFTATIVEEIRFVDGREEETHLTIEGETKEQKLPALTVKAEDFPSLSWVLPKWGVQCVINPGQGVKEDLRTAIQSLSRPVKKTVFRHTGYALTEKGPAFVHSRGAVTPDGHDPDVRVQLPVELSRYDLTPPSGVSNADAFRATLHLTTAVAPPHVGWPLLAAALAPTMTPVDFAVHLTGRTGTFKSELLSLFQSHYGPKMDARHLPGSWSSTANALEAQAYLAKDAAFVIDDFVPHGTAWQQKSYQAAADKIIRAAGNQAGRARLTDTSRLQQSMFPRGVILSTGEDIPEGHSVRARTLILELSPQDITTKKLSAAQANRQKFPATTIHLIQQHLSTPDVGLPGRIAATRDRLVGIGHTRTPAMIATLLEVVRNILHAAHQVKAVPRAQVADYMALAETGILDAGKRQTQYLETADPAEAFLSALRHVLSANLGHLRKLNNGVPARADVLGWTTEQTEDDAEPKMFKAHGPCIGWIDWKTSTVYLEHNSGYTIVRKHSAADTQALSKQTLFKRLKDAGHLARADDQRQRNTVRIQASGHPRTVVAIHAKVALDTKED